MSKADRDQYDLAMTPERRDVLRMVMDRELHTWAGDAIVTSTNLPLSRANQRAFHELARAGLVVGVTFTGKGYAAAVDWGIRQPAKGH